MSGSSLFISSYASSQSGQRPHDAFDLLRCECYSSTEIEKINKYKPNQFLMLSSGLL